MHSLQKLQEKHTQYDPTNMLSQSSAEVSYPFELDTYDVISNDIKPAFLFKIFRKNN